MEIKSYKCNSFNVHTIKTNKFKTAHLEIIFRNEASQDIMPVYAFLSDMLTESNKLFQTRRDLIVKFEELYNLSIYGTTIRTGNILSLNIMSDFINPEYISDSNYLENVLKMIIDIILNPNVENNEFCLNSFNIVKNRLKRDILSVKDNPVKLSIKGALKSLKSTSSIELLGTIDDIDKITPESLYDAYINLLKNFTCDIFLIGNMNMDNTVSIIKKYFKNRYIKSLDLNLYVDQTIHKNKVITNTGNFNQASIVMLFNLNNFNSYERDTVMYVFNYIYGNGGLTSRLYQSIREKNSLCYAISSMYLKYDKLLLVQISLDNINVNKAISLVKKELKNMKNVTQDEVNDAINNILVSLDLSLDNNISILNNYVFNVFYDLPSIEKRKELFKNVSLKDVINISKKIKLNTTYIMEGNSNGRD